MPQSVRLHSRCPLQLLPIPPEHALRVQVESVLRCRYRARHDGAPHILPHTLFALIDSEQNILATAGMTTCVEAGLSNRYLNVPASELIQDLTGEPIRNDQFVEVGQLTAAQAGAGRVLIPALARLLSAQGYRWLIATATAEVRELLTAMGLAPQPLVPAVAEKLGADALTFGTYYDADPWVVYGNIPRADERMMARGVYRRLRLELQG